MFGGKFVSQRDMNNLRVAQSSMTCDYFNRRHMQPPKTERLITHQKLFVVLIHFVTNVQTASNQNNPEL